MQIINRDANIRSDICYRISSRGSICNIGKESILKISTPFEELRKEGKSISNINDLSRVSEIARQRHIAKMKLLRKEQNGGYILIGGLTCIGTFAIGIVIFMAIKFILIK